MYERINWYRKDYIFEQYTRIVSKFKNYDRISRKKMLEEVYKVYEDSNNIIDICTCRELKFLKELLAKKDNTEQFLDNKYEWERKNLRDKFLAQDDFDCVFIPEEIKPKVEEALKNIDWAKAKKMDELNEILVSYCKMQGSALLITVCAIVSSLTGIAEEKIAEHMYNNKLFNYYVYIDFRDFKDKKMLITIYQDYYDIEEELDEQRSIQGIAGTMPLDLRKFKTLFYNDFDINNPKIKKFLVELKKLPFFWFSALEGIREFAMLNIDRTPLKESIANVPSLKDYDLTNFFKVLDAAMDEMPSGALNGFTPNQAKEFEMKKQQIAYNNEKNYVKQQNACLSVKDADLFYKIYFALLEFTNKKYDIKKNFKIYKQLGIDPANLTDIVDKFWENKDSLVLEFCLANPYKFNAEELEITKGFRQGIRGIYFLAKYEEEYTALLSQDKCYMIKGINDNIDNIISYRDLPMPVITTIIPFKNVLVYDSMFLEMGISMGPGFAEVVAKEYDTLMKNYHL